MTRRGVAYDGWTVAQFWSAHQTEGRAFLGKAQNSRSARWVIKAINPQRVSYWYCSADEDHEVRELHGADLVAPLVRRAAFAEQQRLKVRRWMAHRRRVAAGVA